MRESIAKIRIIDNPRELRVGHRCGKHRLTSSLREVGFPDQNVVNEVLEVLANGGGVRCLRCDG